MTAIYFPAPAFGENGYLYVAFGQIFIVADHEDAAREMKRAPHVPAVNKAALDLICNLTQSTATAEAKVMLLKKAIESL